jgi:hypothetical protein
MNGMHYYEILLSDVICDVHCRLREFSLWLGKYCLYGQLLPPRLNTTVQQKGKQADTGGVWDDCDVGGGVSVTQPRKHCQLSPELDVPVPSPIFPDISLVFSRSLQDLGSTGAPPLPLIRSAPVKWEEKYMSCATGVPAQLRAFTLSCLSIKKARELSRGLLMANHLLLPLMQHPFTRALQPNLSGQVNIVCFEFRRAY